MYNTEAILVIDINNINFPIALDTLETVEELEDFVRSMHPYRVAEYRITEARNMPLTVDVDELREPDALQRLIDFNLEDCDTQGLILAFARADYSDPLTWRQYSDIWSMKRAAENAFAGVYDNETEFLFNRFLELRPDAADFADFLNEEKCADDVRDLYTMQDGYAFYKNA